MSVFTFGSTPAADNLPVSKCPVKSNHDCWLANCVSFACEHALPVGVLIGFGAGTAYCWHNYMYGPKPGLDSGNASDTTTGKALE